MKIVLLNLPWKKEGRLGVRAGSRWPFTSEPEKNGYINYIPFPFFLAYATSLLKNKNHNVRLIDAIAEEIDENKLLEEIKSYNPVLIVIETSTPSFENDIRIARSIHDALPNCQIIFCGPHASVFPKQILNEHTFVDYILIGEYEYILLELVTYSENNLNLESVSGLAYRDGSNIKINSRRRTINNLEDFPWPERDILSIYKYNDGFANLPTPNVQMWSSRGCPFRCIFCLWTQALYGEHKYRKRDPKYVIDEMEWLIKKFNFKAVYFDDDVFNIDRNHVLGICEEIKLRKIEIPWAVMARADLMDEAVLKSMVNAKLYAIKYGIESASKNILNFCKKNMDLNKAKYMIKITKELGVKVHLTFCLGLPGETEQTISETTDFINEVMPDSVQFSLATPFPGTEYFRYSEREGYLLSKDWSNYDGGYQCILKTDKLSNKELESAKFTLNNNFNLQQQEIH